MNRYTIYCTEEQTRKALELGAPIDEAPMVHILRNEIGKHCFLRGGNACWFPTAEQMIGWLEGQRVYVVVSRSIIGENFYNWEVFAKNENSAVAYNKERLPRKEATLAAIGAALEFLSNKKNNKNMKEYKSLQQAAIEASKPRYVEGGVFVPALGIVIDLHPLSESAEWYEAMTIANEHGKRLPTIDEWHYIYYHRYEINKIIKDHGGTEIASYHWSSTEYSASYSWGVNFSNGYFGYYTKYYSYVVRAVKDLIK